MSFVWQDLNHDTIFKAIEQTQKTGLSNIFLRRNSYINRVYELEELESQKRLVVKFYRPGRWTPEMILEEHQFLTELKEKEIAVIPPLVFEGKTLFDFNSIPYALFPKKGGRALDEFNPEAWEEIGRLLARIHLIGAMHQISNRITWKPSIATLHHLEVLLKSDFLLSDFLVEMKKTVDLFIEKFDPLFDNLELILLHGDCHRGNLIHRPGEGVFIVDFDDICMGPPVQDLWMLLPDTVERCERELSWFLKGYETFRKFDRSSLELIPVLRGMRMIHFASWLAVQYKDPDFHKHFPEAGTKRYWNELIKDIQEVVYG